MKNFKKLFLITFFLVVFVSFLGVKAPNVQAITVAELQAQIQALLAQITQLQKQLAEIQEGTPIAWCHNFNVNLKIGDKGCPSLEAGGGYAGCNYEGKSEEIEALHKALENEGFGDSSLDKDKFNGEFGEATASAVVGFQERYANEILSSWGLTRGTGFVGQTTRAKLNNLYGCGVVAGTCVNECSSLGQTLCIDANNKRTCGNYDSDSCLEWSSLTSCTGSTICGYGVCSNNQKPSWYCSNGNCLYNCVSDPSCGITCTDSDGGKDYYVKGLVTTSDEQEWDSCKDENILYELTCDEAGGKAYEYECPNGCENGACKKASTTAGSNCQELSDLTSGILKEKGSMGCSNEDYNSYADINKDGWIVPQDALLIGHKVYSVSREESEAWCLEKLNDDTNPCASPTGMESIENQLADISKIISELVEAIK